MNQKISRSRAIAVAGFVALVGNILGVAFLAELPSSYRLARMDTWVEEVFAHPHAATASGLAFTAGLLALALWATGFFGGLRSPASRLCGLLIVLGASLNALGTLATLVVVHHVGSPADGGSAVARALLGSSLALDAVFNVTLGAGLIVGAAGWTPRDGPGWLRGLAMAAGVSSLPVGAQAIYDPAASWLAVAGPLWLSFILCTSVLALRRDRRRSVVGIGANASPATASSRGAGA